MLKPEDVRIVRAWHENVDLGQMSDTRPMNASSISPKVPRAPGSDNTEIVEIMTLNQLRASAAIRGYETAAVEEITFLELPRGTRCKISATLYR